MEQSSCTEDRIQHLLERCLCDLGLNTPDKALWNAGLCIGRWCLEELVKRDPNHFLILLQKILMKTKEVLERCQYELVVPLCLLFSSTLLSAPYVAPECVVLQEASILFRRFLSWPDPCCSASKHLLLVIQQELRAPGISFQRLVRAEQGASPGILGSRTITVLLLNPEEDVPPEVRSVSDQLSGSQQSSSDVASTLIQHGLQAVLGAKHDPRALHAVLQTKRAEELDQLLEAVTESMERAASTADPHAARRALSSSMERIRGSLVPADRTSDPGAVETFTLPFPKCHTCSWENDTFGVLSDILTSDLDSLADCFSKAELDEDDVLDTSVDEEDEAEAPGADLQNHRISTTSSSYRDSTLSGWSVPTTSSGVESDFSEDTEERPDRQPRLRRKPKKKSRSLLGIERFSMLFKTPRSPSACRRAQSMAYHSISCQDAHGTRTQTKPGRWARPRQVHPLQLPPAAFPQRHVCVRRRPILSCSDPDVAAPPTLVRVVVFGGDREAGRLARAYSDLQQKENKSPRLTKMCKLQFYLVPSRRRTPGGPAPTEGQAGGSTKACADSNGAALEDSTADVAQMLGMLDPWYERSILSLLSLPPHVLGQSGSKDGDVSEAGASDERLPLLADMMLYYCRHAQQPVLVQLYRAEVSGAHVTHDVPSPTSQLLCRSFFFCFSQLTLAGGDRRTEVFVHSLELGHSAGTRAVRAMGAASKRLGINEEREAIPLSLRVAYSKVAVSGRSRWTEGETVCTSINVFKACRKPEQLGSRIESLQLVMTEVVKRQSSKSKKCHNQHISVTEIKVDKVKVDAGDDGTTFAVCLDQDEKKFIQSVTRCEVSLCCKAGSSSDWRTYQALPGQVQPLHPSYCSLLCLPITCFSAPQA
ncbi:phosphoinositide 3-kinase regulatory subunit 5-like isoform X5 [Betta splendens]|nr:phosphoinositide 3-kinase regulatory subunit 5-like isoform X5 [Betta splendens]